jgi:two-component system OmpR family sensor kinase
MSLRTRLLAGMALVAVVLVIVSAVITITTRDELIGQIDARLTAFAAPEHGPPRDGGGPFGQPPQPPGGDQPVRRSDAFEGYVDANGDLVTLFTPNVGADEYRPPDIAADGLPSSGSRTFTVGGVGGGSYRVLAERDGDTTLITALPLDDVQRTIRRLVLVEIVGSLAILAALGLVSWWVLHLGIRPVKRMTATATSIAAGDLSVRVPESATGTESGELAVALNTMLGRLEGSLAERAASEERLRQFVADASHELRTPVTTIRGYAELYRHGGLADPAALDDAMRRTEQEAARIGRLVDDMLALARLDEQRPLDVRPVDLAALARDAAVDARAASPGRPIDVELDGTPVVVDGDEDRLRQVIANVIGNAIVHTAPDVPVTIRVEHDATTATLSVVDRGEGMTADVAARVTERFYRADPSRSRHRGGTGLGLSIVDATLSAHGGAVEIDSAPGSGTTVRLTVPRADQSTRSGSPNSGNMRATSR